MITLAMWAINFAHPGYLLPSPSIVKVSDEETAHQDETNNDTALNTPRKSSLAEKDAQQ